MIDLIIIAILLAVIVAIVVYLYRAKKRGQTCIGCSCSKQCGKGCGCCGNRQSVNHN